jgi:hypothetical protein
MINKKCERMEKWDSLDYNEKQKLDPGRWQQEEMKNKRKKEQNWIKLTEKV